MTAKDRAKALIEKLNRIAANNPRKAGARHAIVKAHRLREEHDLEDVAVPNPPQKARRGADDEE